MNALQDLLVEVADEAKIYDGTDRAIQLVRRRRRLVPLVPLVAAAAVVVAVAAVAVPLLRGGSDESLPAAPVSWLPERLTPAKNPQPLPTDRAVGDGSLVYVPTVGEAAASFYYALLTTDGVQYRLPGQSSLSPDGRWLLSMSQNKLLLRDLLGTDVRDLRVNGGADPGSSVAVWAADSSRLVVGPAPSAGCQTVDADQNCMPGADATVVELDTGDQHTVALQQYHDARVCGVRTSGDLVVCGAEGTFPIDIWVVDGGSGKERSHVSVGLSSALTGAERRAITVAGLPSLRWQGMLADGSAMVAQTMTYVESQGVTGPADLVLIDLSSGELTRRFDLPPQAVGTAIKSPEGDVRYTQPEEWFMNAALPEDLVMQHVGPEGDKGDARFQQRVRSLELLNLDTGTRGLTTLVDPGVFDVSVRGTGW